MEVNKALILAAGRGERLRPLTNRIPKTLVELLGLSLIEQVILSIRKVGIKNFVIVNSYLENIILHKLGEGKNLDVAIKHVHNPD